jgi:HSP20 family molecular chaperone IbpA
LTIRHSDSIRGYHRVENLGDTRKQKEASKMRLIPYIRRSEVPARIWPETSPLFDEFFNDFPYFHANARTGDKWLPAVDILEKDGNLMLRAEVPV